MPPQKKETIFKEEQILVKKRLLEILNITKNNNYFTLYDLDNDIEKQNSILELESDCEKYFACCEWTYFRNKKENKVNERPSLVLAKNILTSLNTELINTKITVSNNDNKKIITSKYVIIDPPVF
jgi:hypothetical protein